MKPVRQPSVLWLMLGMVMTSLWVGAQLRRQIEIQLAGVRLGSPIIDRDPEGNLRPSCLVRVWGMPDLIVTATAVAPSAGMPAAPGMPGAPSMPGMPGAPGMPGGAPVGMGSAFGGQPPAGEAMGGMPGPMRPGMPYGGGMPGAEAGMPSAPGMGATGGTTPPTELAWTQLVYIPPQANQRLWLYRRGEGALSFLEDKGIVVAIMAYGTRPDAFVAPDGRRYLVATALGDPFRAIRLGDDLQRVLLRYGAPDSAHVITEQVPLTNIGIGRTVLLRYHERSNVEFTVVDYKVVRIFIFLPPELGAPKPLLVPLGEMLRR
ncbi:MAG: hypothetical protein RRB12_09615 [Armatimonadota bacterium]|nr:hypothetical protein [Armatimonadota bacterium]